MRSRLVVGHLEIEGDGAPAAIAACITSLVQAFTAPAPADALLPAPAEAPRLAGPIQEAPAPLPNKLGRRKLARKKPGRKPGPADVDVSEAAAVALGKRDANRASMLDKIERFIGSVGHATAREIADACGTTPTTINKYLKDARFTKTLDGTYRVD